MKSVLRHYGIKSIPTAMLFDADGNVLETFRASGDAVKEFINTYQADANVQTPPEQSTLADLPAFSTNGNDNNSSSSSETTSTPLAPNLQPSLSAGTVCVTPETPCGLPWEAPAGPRSTLEEEKAAFLKAAGSAYGYNGWLDAHYHDEVGKRLGADRHYLDYTGENVHF